MQFSHPLMHDNFTRADMNAAISLLKRKSKVLTQASKVGDKYSRSARSKN